MATIVGIRDRIASLLTGLAPSTLPLDRFVEFTNQQGADFLEWCETSPQASFRKFQVRHSGDFQTPDVSDNITEGVEATISTIICYPHDHRAGASQAISRDTLIASDFSAYNFKCGLYGRSNFSGLSDCVVLSPVRASRQIASVCDFLVIEQTVFFYRTL